MTEETALTKTMDTRAELDDLTEPGHFRVATLATFWPPPDGPAPRRLASMVADPIMGSVLASLPHKDSAVV
jgi:hypothetical protein